MHPLLESRLRFALYLASWLLLGLLLAAVLRLDDPRPWGQMLLLITPLMLVYASMCLSAFWMCGTMPLGRTPPLRLIVSLIAAACVASMAWVFFGSLWRGFLAQQGWIDAGDASRARDLTVMFITGVPLYLMSALIHYLIIAFENARALERRALESQVVAREAELRALRAQLHPHFLFNSLNSIASLAGSNPDAARRMCEGLGDFLRKTLSLANHAHVPLSDELALVERYLSIEQVRFGERLAVETAVTAEAARCLVPPLLLQPLVENAVKHGVSDRVEGGTVRIEAATRNALLTVAVENPRDDDAPTRRGEGMGIDNVRRRLDALGERDTRLEVESTPGRFRVTLTLPALFAPLTVGAADVR